jgi:imidazole glycerol-phosphate synthase subunit HisH
MTRQRIALVDSGLCNIDSIRRALEECGASPYVSASPDDLREADRIVLPGVGAFPAAMAHLRSTGYDEALTEEVRGAGAPFLGICLGMQLLATTGAEGGDTPGLGWIDGTVEKLRPTARDRRIPHMGWNEVHRERDTALLDDVPDGADFYFVHGYHLVCRDPDDVAGTTPYCGTVTAVVERGNVFGVQFHPEKSQAHGFQVLRNFLALAC